MHIAKQTMQMYDKCMSIRLTQNRWKLAYAATKSMTTGSEQVKLAKFYGAAGKSG